MTEKKSGASPPRNLDAEIRQMMALVASGEKKPIDLNRINRDPAKTTEELILRLSDANERAFFISQIRVLKKYLQSASVEEICFNQQRIRQLCRWTKDVLAHFTAEEVPELSQLSKDVQQLLNQKLPKLSKKLLAKMKSGVPKRPKRLAS